VIEIDLTEDAAGCDREDEVVAFPDPYLFDEDEEEEVPLHLLCHRLQQRRAAEASLKQCSVWLADVFAASTPLRSFACEGCAAPYGINSEGSSLTVDLKCQTLTVECGACDWFAIRRIAATDKVYDDATRPTFHNNLLTTPQAN
jgi:hypothetical protein